MGLLSNRSRNSSVDIVSRLQAGRSGVQISAGRDNLPKLPDRHWGPHILLFNVYRGPFAEVERLRSGVYHAPPSRAEFKNERSYTYTSPVCLHGMGRNRFKFFLASSPFPIKCLK